MSVSNEVIKISDLTLFKHPIKTLYYFSIVLKNFLA